MKWIKVKRLTLMGCLWAASGVFGQDQAISRQALLAAIQQGAEYAATVLLDDSGKCRCDYDLLDGQWRDYEPAWHTGQLIYALLRSYEVSQKSRYLEYAQKAGRWWVGLAITDHPVLKGMVRAIHGDGIQYIIFSTVSDGTAGLFRLSQHSGDPLYARAATQAGEWMYQHMWEPSSQMFYDAVDPETGQVMKSASPFWPEKTNQGLNDVARPNNEGSLFKDMYLFTRDEKYKSIFLQMCNSLVNKQDSLGLWMDFTPNDISKGTFHPRFHLWYAESLLEGYDLCLDRRYLQAALKTARFYATVQQKNGAFYYTNNLDGSADPYSISGSTTAFAGLVWLRLKRTAVTDEFDQNISRSLHWLLDHRYPAAHADKNLAGGFMEIRCKASKANLRILHRDLATSFGLRFLTDYYDANFK